MGRSASISAATSAAPDPSSTTSTTSTSTTSTSTSTSTTSSAAATCTSGAGASSVAGARASTTVMALMSLLVAALSGCGVPSLPGAGERSPSAGGQAFSAAAPSPGSSQGAGQGRGRGRGAASRGCAATAGRLTSGPHQLTTAGLTRRYLLAVPDGPGPHPVLLNLHGLGSDAAEQAVYSRLSQIGPSRGYIVITPQSAPGRLAWTLPHTAGPDDTAYLAALLDEVERHQCAHPGREFAAGLSYGAGLAVSLVCALDGRLSGVAAVAGIPIAQPCAHPVPTTIVAFHGTADRLVPYDGGHPEPGGELRHLAALIVLPPVEQTMDAWAAAQRCSSPVTGRPLRRVRLRLWASCPRGATLRLYTVDGGGHTWPGPIEVPRLGDTARDLDASRLILDAFDRAPTR
ncbi:alpha/beta hydrolase family esterase [Nonomuraea sp. NPDC001831]|uniref:alpha/beta hydrolase family esterase n=1 Tax=Nonomuraea sp. NPDC001831 TaxID=3364340 RepID=UPI0036BFF84A